MNLGGPCTGLMEGIVEASVVHAVNFAKQPKQPGVCEVNVLVTSLFRVTVMVILREA